MATVYTQAGEEFTADLFDGTTAAPANYYVAWGTGSTVAAKGQTALTTESAEARVTATESQPSADVNQFVGTITSASTQTIAEAGLFTASTVGTMVIRGDFTGVPVNNGDSIEFTFQLTWS